MLKVHNWKDAIPFVAPEKSEPALDCDEAVVKCIYLEPGEESPPHVHRNAVDIMVIVEGEGVATVDGKKRRVGAGDVILNPSGTVHGIKNDSTERLTWVVIQSPPPNRKTARELEPAAAADT